MILNVGQHCYSRFFCFDQRDWIKILHVADAVYDRVDFSGKLLPMHKDPLATTHLGLPSRIEEIGARKNDVGMKHIEMCSETHETDEGVADKRWMAVLGSREVGI